MRALLKRAKPKSDSDSISKTLKVVKQLVTTVHTAELFQELSTSLQRALYAYGNTKLYSLLSISLGDDFAHLIPETARQTRDGLKCWLAVLLKHSESSSHSQAWFLRSFMACTLNSTGRRGQGGIKTYVRELRRLEG